ncbi:MAG: hypothetical protein HDR30_08760 [Lachnospiraceae bacterium]|nr:hypothetical protein [Lachnospiraceae bacterium]
MLSVILIWLYMLVTAFLLGYGILHCLTYVCPYQVKRWDSYVMCGLAGVTVYAQAFSIFAPVGLIANVVLAGICLVIACLCRKSLRADLRKAMEAVRKKKIEKTTFLLMLFLLFAYGASRGIIHYDTGLYHAQSIRWIEEYGIVKGLGNLHCRLAYNSASFALSALYSFAFLGGASYHAAAGFFAFLLAVVCSELAGLKKRKSLKPSDFARVMGIYYLLIIFDEMVSPASDYFMVLTAFYIIIRWMDLLEENEQTVFPYAMLCVLGVFLLTIKLSAALIILLVIKPAAALLREKRWKEIVLYLFLGILTVLPFLIRNVILSGWLVYPFTGIDLFSSDWKIPKGIADYDAREIQVWGRGYHDVTKYDMPIWKWLPDWFRGISGMDKIFVLAALLAVLVFVLRLLVAIWKGWWQNAGEEKEALRKVFTWDKLLLEGVVSVCFLFWLFSSPLIRYGCVYVYLTSAVIWGDMAAEFFHFCEQKLCREKNGEDKKRYWKYPECACMILICLFLGYKAVMFGRELSASYVNDYWICQKDYDNYETQSYEIDGVTFYYPVTGDQTGYKSFPSSPTPAKIGLRGDTIRDGFFFCEED